MLSTWNVFTRKCCIKLRRQACSRSSSLWPEYHTILVFVKYRQGYSKPFPEILNIGKIYICYVGHCFASLIFIMAAGWSLTPGFLYATLSNLIARRRKKGFNAVTSADITEIFFLSSSCSLCLGWRVESRVSSFQQKPRLEFQMAK